MQIFSIDISNPNPTIYKNDYTSQPSGIYPGMQAGITFKNYLIKSITSHTG